MLGYLFLLKHKVEAYKEKNDNVCFFLCEPIFKFESYKKLLKLIGIRNCDSKILTRASNIKRIIKNALGYDTNKQISLETLEKELCYQINFFANIADQMCFDTDNENFSLYILRFDLKKCKS